MIKSVVSTALPVDEKLEIQKNRIMPLRLMENKKYSAW